MLRAVRNIFLFVAVSFLFQSCQSPEKTKKVKYCFLFIGDGMGVAQVNLTEAYLAAIDKKKGFQQLSFTQYPHAGLVKTFANDRFITCSAAAGTAFATGYKTNIGHISTDSSGKVPFKSIATICKESGMKVGVLSSVSIDHATPAVFYAHQPSRNSYFEIGTDLANSNFDFFGGGGFRVPDGEIDGKPIDLYELSAKNGFTVVKTSDALSNLSNNAAKAFAVHPNLLSSGAMPYVIDKPEGPTLADFTKTAISQLENENGFFIMVEGGKIDWACHSDDAATAIHETIAFDKAIQVAYDFYQKYPDETLIVVTADHETGGLALGNNKTQYETNYQYLQYQKASIDVFNEKLVAFQKNLPKKKKVQKQQVLKFVGENFGLGFEIPITEEEKDKIWASFREGIKTKGGKESTYTSIPPLTGLLISMMSEKSGVGWTTMSHTGINIPIYAVGSGAEQFDGVIDNTDIPKIMLEILEIKPEK